MTLEGSLEAFSLPDIFQLLSFTKKTGALRITRNAAEGVVWFGTGSVTGATSDTGRQALGRRLVGAGLVGDDELTAAIEVTRDDPATGLGKALHDAGAIDDGVLHEQVVEQATDAVFDLLRWTSGDFAFMADEANPDDLGVSLVVEEVITEARQRLERWETLTKTVPSPDSIVGVALSPGAETSLTPEEWNLLALVDGDRTVSQLVRLTGRGEFATVSTLASLVERKLVTVRRPGDQGADGVGALLRRQSSLSALEGRPEPIAEKPAPEPEPAPEPAQPVSAALADLTVPDVVPSRPEPILPRTPDFREEAPRRATAAVATGGRTSGSSALADPQPGTSSVIERDPSVNKSLLLRLIAGVRGL